MGNFLALKSRGAEYCRQMLKSFYLGGLCPPQEPDFGGLLRMGYALLQKTNNSTTHVEHHVLYTEMNIPLRVSENSVIEETTGFLLLFNFC